MAEEVANSSVVVPHSMLFAIAINGILGFAMLIAFLFTAGDFTAILKSQAKSPFMHILENSTKSKGATIVLSSMIAIMQACAGLGGISSGSRMLWAFSRERALPGWRWIHKVCSAREIHIFTFPIDETSSSIVGQQYPFTVFVL